MPDRLGPGLQGKAWETRVALGSYVGWRARLVPKQGLRCQLAASQPGAGRGAGSSWVVSYASFKAHPRRPLLKSSLASAVYPPSHQSPLHMAGIYNWASPTSL